MTGKTSKIDFLVYVQTTKPMDHLKDRYLLADPTDRWHIFEYMRHKHAPEAEKLAKLTGPYILLSPLCPNPNEFKPVKDHGIAARSPHVSLHEYLQFGSDDGYHWNSKQLANDKCCYSLYPTLEMLQRAHYVSALPRNCLIRYAGRLIHPFGLVQELFDWKN